ncbi:hypothetical protein GCM10023086_01970 [Streptomyces venetus]|uniref:Uncharacterized protein n=1 Tax=Streptomyces venetus TaxID=1701086 RepID=A0ABP8F197_9ACTN
MPPVAAPLRRVRPRLTGAEGLPLPCGGAGCPLLGRSRDLVERALGVQRGERAGRRGQAGVADSA